MKKFGFDYTLEDVANVPKIGKKSLKSMTFLVETYF